MKLLSKYDIHSIIRMISKSISRATNVDFVMDTYGPKTYILYKLNIFYPDLKCSSIYILQNAKYHFNISYPVQLIVFVKCFHTGALV